MNDSCSKCGWAIEWAVEESHNSGGVIELGWIVRCTRPDCIFQQGLSDYVSELVEECVNLRAKYQNMLAALRGEQGVEIDGVMYNIAAKDEKLAAALARIGSLEFELGGKIREAANKSQKTS